MTQKFFIRHVRHTKGVDFDKDISSHKSEELAQKRLDKLYAELEAQGRKVIRKRFGIDFEDMEDGYEFYQMTESQPRRNDGLNF